MMLLANLTNRQHFAHSYQIQIMYRGFGARVADPAPPAALRRHAWVAGVASPQTMAQALPMLSEWLGTPGGEKPFRLFVASVEIAATVLVLIPRTQWFGGLFASGIMAGAIFFHTVSPLGIDPYGDGGILFREAVITFLAGLLIVAIRRDEAFAFARRAGVLRPA
jgi:uncharacterized membrane protein YphA (DoxX/SURF4 family)